MSTIGIDLGTTNSAIAAMTNIGRAEIVPGTDGARTFPSAVFIERDGGVQIGRPAKEAAIYAPDRVAQFFKRDMGSTSPALVADSVDMTPEALSAALLRGLIDECADGLEGSRHATVISVPAYFHNVHREATARAGLAAGLDVLGTVNEPTAAALAYAQYRPDLSGTLLVYDLGGGTFDVTLVDYGRDRIDVIASTGNHALGGKDWDDALLRLVADRIQASHGVDIFDDWESLSLLRSRCEHLKLTLSVRASGHIAVDCHGVRENLTVTREDFEAATANLLEQTRVLVSDLISETGIHWPSIQATLLVGGSTRMPAVRALVEQLSGRMPRTDLNPDEAVAVGAAIRAEQMGQPTGLYAVNSTDTRIRSVIDVCSHTLGYVQISADGSRYINGPVLKKSTPLPASESRPGDVSTRSGENNSVEVIVLQGDAERVLDNEPVKAYVVSGVPHSSGKSTIDVTFGYDVSGIVQVTARDRASGTDLIVTPSAIDDLLWTDEDPRDHVRAASVDVVFIIDTSGSMGDEIDAVKRNCVDFAEHIERVGAAVRLGVVGFGIGNSTLDRPPWKLGQSGEYTFGVMAMADPRAFKQAMEDFRLCSFGGGGCYVADAGTTGVFDAAYGLFDDDRAVRMVILISDEIGSTAGLVEIVERANLRRITAHVLGVSGHSGAHEKLARLTNGMFWDIKKSATQDFSTLLGEVATEIARSIAREHVGASGISAERRCVPPPG